jgi:hypothetical protein
MGGECILFSFLVGLYPFFYGFWIAAIGEVHLWSRSRAPIRGTKARLLGVATVLAAVAYYVVVVWAWSHYDR